MQAKKNFVPFNYKYLFVCIFILLSLLFNLRGNSFVFADNEEANMLYDLGKRNLQKRKFNKAIGYLQKAVEENPDFEEAWYELGNAYYSKGDLKSAIKNYYIAMGVNQDFKKPLKKIGKCYLEQKRYNLAINKFKKASEHFPGDSSINYISGQAYEKTGDWNNAISAYTRAESLDKEKYGFLKEKIDKLKKKADPQPAVIEHPSSAPTPVELPDTIPAEIPHEETVVPSPLSTDAIEESPSPGVNPSLLINEDGKIKARFPLTDDKEDSAGQKLQSSIDWLKTSLFVIVILIIVLVFVYLYLKITGKKEAVSGIGPPRFLDMPDVPEDFFEDDEEVEDFDAPSRFFYKEVITDEREKKKVRHEDTILRIREKLKKEELDALLAGEEGDPGISLQPEKETEPDFARETITVTADRFSEEELIVPSVGEKKSSLKSSLDEAEKSEKIVEEQNGETPKPEKYLRKPDEELAMKEKEDDTSIPFVCSCGKIIRNGGVICPRCGRGSR
ncbi:MAG: tetratricopeptide repeat protein [Candidatus Eremiobacteraeota bacterium]|nr:tetratricopeptide repeat protein [Candidatus Eremiobacteraeota bacterium]